MKHQPDPYLKKQVAGHTACLVRTLRKIDPQKVNKQQIAEAVEERLLIHPQRTATQHQAAIHEASHFVAFEVTGMCAGRANIKGSPFGRHGWGGTAWSLTRPLDRQPCSPTELLAEAKASLAGPLGEELLAAGDAFSSIGELLEAHILALQAAKMSGCGRYAVWHDILLDTVRTLERHTIEIQQLADLLMRRRLITRWDVTPLNILRRIQRTPPAAHSVSEQGVEIVRQMEIIF